MGNMSSKNPEDAVFNRFDSYMKGGGCKEAYTAFIDCVEKAEKEEGNGGKCLPMLVSCLEAHADYYKPVFEAKRKTEEEMDKVLEAMLEGKGKNLVEAYFGFMEGGGCGESFRAAEFCRDEAENKGESTAKCAEGFSMLKRCMESRSDYYQPYLDMRKTGDDMLMKELDALLRNR